MEDDGFKLPSSNASASLQAARELYAWCLDCKNESQLSSFAALIHSKLETALTKSAVNIQKQREKMWGIYHSIRSSDEFVVMWKKFLVSSPKCAESPILFQNITDRIFRKMMAMVFTSIDEQDGGSTVTAACPLSYQETNALRYAAGYIYRTVKDRVMKKSMEWLLSLEELLDEELAIEEAAVPSSSNWIHNVNRGGLYFVSDDAFDVFIAIENVIRRYYCRSKARELSCGKKEEIMEEVMRDEEVKMNWSIVALDMNVEIGKELLKMIVEEWIKIGGSHLLVRG